MWVWASATNIPLRIRSSLRSREDRRRAREPHGTVRCQVFATRAVRRPPDRRRRSPEYPQGVQTEDALLPFARHREEIDLQHVDRRMVERAGIRRVEHAIWAEHLHRALERAIGVG